MKSSKIQSISWILLPVVAVCAVLWLFTAISNLEQGRDMEGKKQLEDAVRRAALSCYASEGSYPPSIDYLKKHYGIQIDESRYVVYYDIQAQNLMPEITVIELGG